MKIRQISVFLENKVGRVGEITRILGDNNINIRALSLADTSDFGILRMIVDDIEKALKALRGRGIIVKETAVVAVEVPDKPGGLTAVLDILTDNGINVEYMYAFFEQPENGVHASETVNWLAADRGSWVSLDGSFRPCSKIFGKMPDM